MKYLIASDIHGSSADCKRLITAFEREKAERLILLGDILYHGPRNDLPESYAPRQVIDLLNPLKDRIIAVRGNCDAEVDLMVLEFPLNSKHKVMDLCGKRFFLTHGHRYSIEHLPDPAFSGGADFILYGHTHVPLNEARGGVRCMNPGSVSIPKNGSWRGYMTVDENGVLWKELDGTVKDSFVW